MSNHLPFPSHASSLLRHTPQSVAETKLGKAEGENTYKRFDPWYDMQKVSQELAPNLQSNHSQ